MIAISVSAPYQNLPLHKGFDSMFCASSIDFSFSFFISFLPFTLFNVFSRYMSCFYLL